MKITNGIDIFEVTRGAYEGIYINQGYVPYEEAKAPVVEQDEEAVEEQDEDDIFISEIEEKPIANWNKQEVKRYASLKGIDISGTKNPNEAKEIIKDFLQ